MREQLKRLRDAMKAEGISVWYMGMGDPHMSEYVSPYDKVIREYSGFTGSAGTLVVAPDTAALFTDGRYFLQAERQLEGSGIELMRMDEPGVPDTAAYVRQHMPEGGVLGFNGRCVSAAEAERLAKALRDRMIALFTEDLPGRLWTDRPAPVHSRGFMLSEVYTGMSCAEKLSRIRERMQEKGAEGQIIASLDDIAWITGLRGDDIPYCPMLKAFLLIDRERCVLYLHSQSLTEELRAELEKLPLEVAEDTEQIYEDVKHIASRSVLVDKSRISHELLRRLPDGTEVLDGILPSTLLKRIKNTAERENLRKVQLKDSTAVTRFIYWMKQNLGKLPMSEMSLQEKLLDFRKEQEGFIEESFGPISAYGENAAVVHYSSAPEHDRTVEERRLYLIDSGAHYPEGTTDITRTIVCGPLSREEKEAYTLAVCANLRLADLRFPEGTNGVCLDLAARKLFWDRGLDYRHGTGHGVGYMMNVHEGPCAFRSRVRQDAFDHNDIREGIYISDEPGFYEDGAFGVRIENLLLCTFEKETPYGRFCRFEALTLVPFEREGIDPSLMTEEDIALWNAYHRRVFEALKDRLSPEERDWLAAACSRIGGTNS